MELPGNPHGAHHVLGVVIVKREAPIDEARELPAALLVLEHKRVVYAKLSRNALGERFAPAVDDLLRSDARHSIHVGRAVNDDLIGGVCKAFLDGLGLGYR